MRVVSVEMENRQVLPHPYSNRSNYTGVDVLNICVREDMREGRGFAVPNTALGETAESLLAEAKAFKSVLELGLCKGREHLLQLLPPGGTRQAVDFALWDLECQFSASAFRKHTGLQPRSSLHFTDLSDSQGRDLLSVIEKDIANTFRLSVKDRASAEYILELDAASRNRRWIITIHPDTPFAVVRMLLSKLNSYAVVAIEWPASRLREGLALCDAKKVPLSLIYDDYLPPRIQLQDQVCQYVSLSMADSGGLTQIVERIQQARLLGVGTILSDTWQCAVNTHATDLILSLCDWVSLEDHTGPGVLGSSGKDADISKSLNVGGSLV